MRISKKMFSSKTQTVRRALTFLLTLALICGITPLMGPEVSAEASAASFASGWSPIHVVFDGLGRGDLFMAIKEDGSLWVWGSNGRRQFGTGSDQPISEPMKLMDDLASVALSELSHFVIKKDGSLLGAIHTDSTHLKVMDDVAKVSATPEGASWALKTDGSLWRVWREGLNYESAKAADGFVDILSLGAESCLALKEDGSLWLFRGRLLRDDYNVWAFDRNYTLEKVMDGISSVVKRGPRVFVIRTDGSLWAWGQADASGHHISMYAGTLGDGTSESRSGPISDYSYGYDETVNPVKIMDDVAYISPNRGLDAYNLIVKTDGSLWGWGHTFTRMDQFDYTPPPEYGPLGPTNINTLSPIHIRDGEYVYAAVTSSLAYAVTADGTLWAWGINVLPHKVMDGLMLRPPSAGAAPSAPTTPPPPAPPAPPSNAPSSWAADQVNAAIAANLVPQNLQSSYTQSTTRAEFAALAVTLYENVTGDVIETGSSPFTDTNDVNALKAAAIGVTTGTTATTFSPDVNLSREQAATMLSRLADAIGQPLPQQAATFNDNANIAPWAFEAVGQMQVTEIMGGIGDNTFSPKGPYTREQSIITIMRLYDIVS